MTRIAYFVHDLSDPAVVRRLRMLRAGGAEPVLFGFRRTDEPIATVDGFPAHDLGRTYDARMGNRALQTLRRTARPGRLARDIEGCDIVLARNLEMLAIAQAARKASRRRPSLVYEALDIHRLLVGSGMPSRLLRAFEGSLLASCDALVVSSPAFVRAHFQRYSSRPKVILLENKLLQLEAEGARPSNRRPSGPPWRIGWFGMLRCAKSLELLRELVIRAQGAVEVDIRGRPAYTEFEDFHALVTSTPGLSYNGSYTAADLPEIYRSVHFCWAIDYFEEGLNSKWLLPNRLYEGSYYGAVPIALEGVETAGWLASHEAGVRVHAPGEELVDFFEGLSQERYRELSRAVAAVPQSDLVAGSRECEALVMALESGANRS